MKEKKIETFSHFLVQNKYSFRCLLPRNSLVHQLAKLCFRLSFVGEREREKSFFHSVVLLLLFRSGKELLTLAEKLLCSDFKGTFR